MAEKKDTPADEILDMIRKLADAISILSSAMSELTTRVNKLESLILRTYEPTNDIEIQ